MRKTKASLLVFLMAVLLQFEPALAISCTWVQLDVEGPPARHSPAMAYDSRRGVVVLFGGFTGRDRDALMYGDTWEWDGTEWKRVDTEQAPSGRSRVAMAYDPNRQAVVLFGGRLPDGQPAGDTWQWDGERWTQLESASPHARARHGMVYEPKLGTLISHGVAFAGNADTIVFDGQHWETIPGTDRAGSGRGQAARGALPVRRIYYGMVYDGARESTLLFGGWDGSAPLGDTWELRCE